MARWRQVCYREATMTRRGLFALLAGLPFVGKLVAALKPPRAMFFKTEPVVWFASEWTPGFQEKIYRGCFGHAEDLKRLVSLVDQDGKKLKVGDRFTGLKAVWESE